MLKPILTMVIVLVVCLGSMACRRVDPELLEALFSDLSVSQGSGICNRTDNSWR
ncbi:hypothetical protein [Bartonella sp. WD12.1]|uniref:hypothetical protein n=1 Tax=Bartonella sp. WD12.1 TaxID=1933903 RepID=UPI0009D4B89C|nr:hypothetical protein [Bartonella sp. WD12.1]OPB30257.1 hypothetical protein BWD121_013120 [Bartonella sp. WD12.1]